MAAGKSYEKALRDAEAELAREKRQREEKDLRIARLEQTVAGLRALIEPRLDFTVGFTDAIRGVLQASSQPLRAVDVRSALEAMGKSLAGHRNPMASVHSVLARLVKSGELTELTHERTKYFWWKSNGPAPSLSMALDEEKERR